MERLFLAVWVPAEVREQAVAAQERIKRHMPKSRISWTAPERMHLTLHFLGDTDPLIRDALVSALREREYPKPFELIASGVSAFPNKKDPKTIVLETRIPSAAAGLRKRTADVLAEFGIPVESRPWKPHITLGRVKVRSEVLKPEEVEVAPVRFSVDAFSLVRSTRSSEGSVYETLAEFPL